MQGRHTLTLTMDDFCGDASNAWGISAKGYLTHCFDDLVLFGATYIFLFVAGSYRAWTLLHVPPAVDFPYSTRHSVKVLVLGWLGLFPIVLFAAKYAQGTHDDFEWVAKPLGSVAWLFSLWLLNMEVARDLRECWVLRVFWASSAGAGTLALPTVVLAAQTNGYGLVFYVYLLHYVLYCTITMLAFRFPHLSHKQTPELIGFGGDGDDSVMGAAATREKNEARLHQGFLTALWRERFLRLMSLYAPERLYIAASFVCMCGGVTLNGLALVVIGRLFNNFYYPYSPDSARGHMREYCVALIFVYIMSSSFDAAYTALVSRCFNVDVRTRIHARTHARTHTHSLSRALSLSPTHLLSLSLSHTHRCNWRASEWLRACAGSCSTIYCVRRWNFSTGPTRRRWSRLCRRTLRGCSACSRITLCTESTASSVLWSPWRSCLQSVGKWPLSCSPSHPCVSLLFEFNSFIRQSWAENVELPWVLRQSLCGKL